VSAQNPFQRRAGLATSFLASGAMLILCLGPARPAEQPSRAAIVEALKGEPPSRSLTGTEPARSPAEQRLLEDLRKSPTRSLSSGERETLKVAARDRRSIDLEIYFETNSAVVGPKAAAELDTLGEALNDPSLEGGQFMIAGHTDAKGSGGYNQKLSERRALAVEHYLIQKARVPAARLVAIGYGKEQYKNPADPLAAENRRVQIVNLNAKATAQRK
jgi:outer membrane protein OmpA-like peptidoglycan-associated protein